MNIKLVSDFHEFYDHHFSSEGKEFRRISTEGPSRPEIWRILEEEIGLATPQRWHKPFNTSSDILVIAFTDINAHRGEGKQLCMMSEAYKKYPDSHVMQYVDYEFGTSYRYLKIGERVFWLKYKSDDWRSNINPISIEVIPKEEYHIEYNAPLFAIDFIKTKVGDLLAVDLNIAPGTSPVQDIISAKEVYEEIETWFTFPHPPTVRGPGEGVI